MGARLGGLGALDTGRARERGKGMALLELGLDDEVLVVGLEEVGEGERGGGGKLGMGERS